MTIKICLFLVTLSIFQLGCTASVSGPNDIFPDLLAQKEEPKPQSPVASLATAEKRACAIASGKLYCWGNDTETALKELANLKNPKQVTIDFKRICVLDDDGVKCSASDGITVPLLKNPKQISAGVAQTCALDDEGVKCWGYTSVGYSSYNLLKVPALKGPTFISAGETQTCAITENGIECWGYSSSSLFPKVTIQKPNQIVMNSYFGCALADKVIDCWSTYESFNQEIRKLNEFHPIQLAMNNSYFCAIGDKGVTCVSQGDDRIKMTPPSFREPNLVSVARDYACAADADGVKCWGAYTEMGNLVPEIGPLKPVVAPTANGALSYSEAAGGRCLKSWNWESASGLICVNQGYFSFFNIVNKTPQNFSLALVDSSGGLKRFNLDESNLKSGSVYKITMSTSAGSTLSFDGIDFGKPYYDPKSGYVLYNGNSGTCAPIVSGTRGECLKEVQRLSNYYSDSVNIDSFNFTKDSVTVAGSCSLKALKGSYYNARFEVISEKCEIDSKTFKKSQTVEFDLRDSANYPQLTKGISGY